MSNDDTLRTQIAQLQNAINKEKERRKYVSTTATLLPPPASPPPHFKTQKPYPKTFVPGRNKLVNNKLVNNTSKANTTKPPIPTTTITTATITSTATIPTTTFLSTASSQIPVKPASSFHILRHKLPYQPSIPSKSKIFPQKKSFTTLLNLPSAPSAKQSSETDPNQSLSQSRPADAFLKKGNKLVRVGLGKIFETFLLIIS